RTASQSAGGPMKKLLLASTALVALGGQALAADLPVGMPVKAPIAAPIPVFSWTGCYVGGHVGVGWGRKDFSEPTEPFGQNSAPIPPTPRWPRAIPPAARPGWAGPSASASNGRSPATGRCWLNSITMTSAAGA